MDANTHVVPVEGVGAFVCRRRTMRVAVAISAEYNRLTEGAENVSHEFAGVCNFLAYLRVIVITGPDGWNPYEVDPDDNDAMDVLRKVYVTIKEAEARFRGKPGKEPQVPGEGSGGVN